MTEQLEAAGCPVDLEEAEQRAQEDVVADREAALAKKLSEMKSRQRKLVDPLQFEMSIQAEDLSSYVPAFGYEMAPASEKQLKALENFGIFADEIECSGKASMLLDRLNKRQAEGLSRPKQIRILEKFDFNHVGQWSFNQASNMISRIQAQGWKRVPPGIDPYTYTPPKQEAFEW